MTEMAAVNAEGRIRRSDTRQGMVVVTSANETAWTAHPCAMNSATFQIGRSYNSR